jgi:hypothetical protein
MNRKISKSLALCLADAKQDIQSAAKVSSPPTSTKVLQRKWSLPFLLANKKNKMQA